MQGNTGNILYIKSTDDSMLEILQGLSGKMHRLEDDSQTVSRDMYKVVNTKDGKLSTNVSVKEVDVISKNDMLQIPKGNLMVFGKGNPVWNRNQLAMPYSFMSVHSNALTDFADPQDYTLRTVPTTANTMDFDILQNQPDFLKMVTKRTEQARLTKQKMELYKQRGGAASTGSELTDDEMAKLDPEMVAKEVMRAINQQLRFNAGDLVLNPEAEAQAKADGLDEASLQELDESDLAGGDLVDEYLTQKTAQAKATAEDNVEMQQARAAQEAEQEAFTAKLYADGLLAKRDLVGSDGGKEELKNALQAAYAERVDGWHGGDGALRVDENQNLIGPNGQVMIKWTNGDLGQTADDGDGEPDFTSLLDGVNSAEPGTDPEAKCQVTDAWLEYLSQQADWSQIDNGEYEKAVARNLRQYGWE